MLQHIISFCFSLLICGVLHHFRGKHWSVRRICFTAFLCCTLLELLLCIHGLILPNQHHTISFFHPAAFTPTTLYLYYLGALLFYTALIFQQNKNRSVPALVRSHWKTGVLWTGGFFLMHAAFYTGLQISTYTIQISGLPSQLNGMTIAHISDLHGEYPPAQQERLLNEINTAHPDLILLTGDITDENHQGYTEILPLLQSLSETAPVYYVPGNHEHRSLPDEQIQSPLPSILLLKDSAILQSLHGEDILIAGLDDPGMGPGYDQNTQKVLQEIQNQPSFSGLKILLSHHPELTDLYINSEFHLVFSGHAHGGQIRFPFTNLSLTAPNQGLFPRYTSGLYSLDESTVLLVSRGLYTHPHAPRIFNRTQLILVTLYA